MAKYRRYLLGAAAPLAVVGVYAAYAAAVPLGAVQITSFTTNSSDNGKRQELGVNPANGKAMTIVATGSRGNSGGKETFSLPLGSGGAAAGAETMLLTGSAVNQNTQPSVGFNPETGEALTCFGDLTATEVACQLLNADGTKKGSPFPVSSGWTGTDYQQSSVLWSPVLKQYMVLVGYPGALYTLPVSPSGTAGTPTTLPFTGGAGRDISGGTDLAYSSTSNTFMAVFVARRDTEEYGVWALSLDGEGRPVGSAERVVADMTLYYGSGSIAWNAGTNQFMVVAANQRAPYNLSVQSFDAAGGAPAGSLQTFQMPGTIDNSTKYRPLIASHSSADQALIVFAATDATDAALETFGLEATSTSLASSPVRIDGSATEATGPRPRVQFNPVTCKYLLTYQKESATAGWQLFSNQYAQDLPCPKPEPQPQPSSPGASNNQTAAPTPVVSQVGAVRSKALSGGRTQVVVNLRYNVTGRYSLFLQTAAAKRVPLLRGSRVGTRLLTKTFLAPVVQDGVASKGVTIKAVVQGRIAKGSALRAILRQPSGALEGANIPVS